MSLYYLKQTVFASRLVDFHFHDFNIRCKRNHNEERYQDSSKYPPGNLQRRLLTPFAWQELTEPTESMDIFLQEDDDEDSEILRELSNDEKNEGDDQDKMDVQEDDAENNDEQDEYIYEDIYISSTTICIGGKRRFQFHGSVLSACVLPGNNESKGEDSLIITLESGFLLILRVQLMSDGCLEPIIVQRFGLSNGSNESKLVKLGYHVTCFRPGNLVAVSAFSNVIRLFKVEYNKFGIPALTSSTNLLTAGIILKTCFLEPARDDHVMILNLVSTDNMMLHLEFNEFYVSKELASSVKKSVFSMLSVKFEIPYFIVPLEDTKGVLFIQETQCSVRGSSYFLSRDESDMFSLNYPLTSTGKVFKPTAYYIPKSEVTCLPCEEYDDPELCKQQVLVSSAPHALYLLDIFYHIKKSEWRMQLRKLFTQPAAFTHFAMEEVAPLRYDLTYTNDKGNCETKDIQLVPRRSGKEGYAMKVVGKESTETCWFPLYDFAVVDSFGSKSVTMTSAQEFWCLGRTGKKSALFCLRKGIPASKYLVMSEFKGAQKLYMFVNEESHCYYVASFPYKSMIFCIEDSTEDNDDVVMVLDDFGTAEATVHFGSLGNNRFIQIFEDGFRIGGFQRLDSMKSFKSSYPIVLAASDQSYVAVAYESKKEDNIVMTVECFRVADNTNDLIPVAIEADALHSQLSMIQFIRTGVRLYLALGDFDNGLHFYCQQDDEKFKYVSTLNIAFAPNSEECFTLCHSLCVVDDENVVLTSKDGSYIVLKHDEETESFIIACTVHIGNYPVDIVPCGEKEFYLVSKCFWKLDLKQSVFPKRIWVSEGSDRRCISCVLLPRSGQEWISQHMDDHLLAIRDDGLDHIYVSGYVSSNYRKVNLGVQGLRMKYYEHQRLFIVISVDFPDLNKLIFVDRGSRRILKSDEKENNIFRADEYPVTIYEWKIPSIKRDAYIHHHIVVGCLQRDTGGGSIKIIEIKKSRENVALRLLYSWDESAPVYAVNQLSDSTLVYGSGLSLLMKRYLPEESRMGDSIKAHEFLSMVKGISVVQKSNEVLINTAKDSFYKFKYDGDNLQSIQNGSVARVLSSNSICHRSNWSEDDESNVSSVITVADKEHCTVSTLRLKNYGNLFNSSSTEVNAKVPFIPRILACDFRPVWRSARKDGTREQSVDSFLAVGINGQIDLFTLITKVQFDLLKDCQDHQLNATKDSRFLPLRDLCPLELVDSSSKGLLEDFNVINGDSLKDKLDQVGNLRVDEILHMSQM
ncbi:hypothetical protein FOA43_000543 [Brettanomyces nanus]|uniref:Cleavage/polyadenylation specificity factor A subunit N-terminal domain-containing protein n=1 Tax=Eeniella nana TaxID=13502 RepID=A0A875RWI5_EENNA|nr:uncharacterized protein FOA43_000543 [Brettanomyces nanus]QPG73236.1 hypothetical protein FOA43_000543 [Brettanomyces nanus]